MLRLRTKIKYISYWQSPTAWKVFSSPYFPVFIPTTWKYVPKKTPYLGTFHAVNVVVVANLNKSFQWFLTLRRHEFHYRNSKFCPKVGKHFSVDYHQIYIKAHMRMKGEICKMQFFRCHLQFIEHVSSRRNETPLIFPTFRYDSNLHWWCSVKVKSVDGFFILIRGFTLVMWNTTTCVSKGDIVLSYLLYQSCVFRRTPHF